ncbi:MAG: undecaprenyldiphospho-muramoylpentapeptide beta-N-acetylglucosaminyltransferase [Ruminococcaceae bacterium]|nr:undecaprenyldiphospho-muramoylpentapeptide beta-N-acetylglucosaminyltransferase [Oscillospiraceae bacterium]
MKVVMTGGGTAGHVNPALSIADIIRKYEPDSEIEFIGTKKGLEYKLVPRRGYKLHRIRILGIKRSLHPRNLVAAVLTCTSYIKSRALLAKIKPDVVVGTGGYVTWPVASAAAALGIPCVLHEANAVPGLAVKMLRNKANVVFVNFKETGKYLSDSSAEVIHTGMPINDLFYNMTREEARKKLGSDGKYKYTILSFGGSLGAAHLNDVVVEFMENFVSKHPEICHIHSAGTRNNESAFKAYKEKGLEKYENCKLVEYIYDMPEQMLACDIVICRSGASTLAELAAIGKPSVLVPSPHVTNDQQYKNAKLLADKDAAVVIRDADLTAERLEKEISGLLSDSEKLAKMGKNAKEFDVANGDEIIYKKIKELSKT